MDISTAKYYLKTLLKKHEDVITRAAYTFVQAALATIAVSGGEITSTVLVAAVAAGLSAIKTLVLNSLAEKADKEVEA